MESLKTIQTKFDQVLQHSQDLSTVNTDSLFRLWKVNKAWFIDKVGDLIYTYPDPVVFDLDDESRKTKVDEFIEWVYREYGEEMYEFFKFNYDGILENKLPSSYNGFPKGMKLSRVLLKEFGIEAEDVRQKLSMLIQSNKVTGKLCLSVHPLDYLSASENNHGWRSCHALDGEYRSGNLSYMVDECTIIAYLKSDSEDTTLPRFPRSVPWNDKKWRVYLHIDRTNEIVYAGRQYPFFTKKGLDIISKIFKQLQYFSNYHRSALFPEYTAEFHPWGLKGTVKINDELVEFVETKLIVAGNQYGEGVKIVPITNYIQNTKEAMNFNDVTHSHTYAPWVMGYGEGHYLPNYVDKKLMVGGNGTPCVCCGIYNVADSDTMVCNNCNTDGSLQCDRCGDTWPASDITYVDRYGYLCPECYTELFENDE